MESVDATALVNEVVRSSRPQARRIAGVAGESDPGPLPPLRALISGSGAGLYTLLALGLFAALDEATAYLLAALAPEISTSLGVSQAGFSALAAQRQLFAGLVALQFAYLCYRRPRRGSVSKQLGVQYGVSMAVASLLTSAWWMSASVGAVGSGTGVVYAAHRPLIMDSYPPAARLRALSIHRGAGVLGAVVGPVLLIALAGPLGLTWRGILLVCGLGFLVLSLAGLALRDPGFGRFDTDPIAALVPKDGDEPALTDDPTELGFWEAVRRVWLIPTVRRVLVVWGVLGVAVSPLVSYQSFYMQQEFHLSPSQRAGCFALCWTLAPAALWWVGRHGEQAWRLEPARLLRITAAVMGALAGGLLLSVVPVLGISLLGFAVVFAAEAVAVSALSFVLLAVVRPRQRPIAGALSALFAGLVGGEGGSLLLGGIGSQYSVAAAIVVLAVPALLAARLMRNAAATVQVDLDALIDEVLEDQAVRTVTQRGYSMPLLSCQDIDFSYGSVQFLFGVDFTVRDGEMLALLGVNGAGKSTLLKVVSGIGLPSSGSVRYRGADITYLDAERRVRMGITQMAGGRAVFGPLTVVENLRGLGYSLGKDKRRLDAAIDECFATFPRLAERRNQPASTLSGGEQQMLSLSKALILKPQLLLIDELTLGLAPIIVDQLLDMVRRINAAGAAVVLVEQSISVALSVVDHAYFMEKGEVRFDGPAAELTERDDLLRAVFLGAAAAGAAQA